MSDGDVIKKAMAKRKKQSEITAQSACNDLLSGLYRMAELAKRPHYYCEDGWYSCPLAEYGCYNDSIPKDECTCGADNHNAEVDALLSSLIR